MTTYERTREARHAVGAGGSVVLHTIAARVIVRGVDGDEARVVLRYALRSPDELAAQRIEEAFDARTVRSAGRLEASSGEGRRIAIDAGPFAAIARAFGITMDDGMQLEAEVPHGASLRVETMSGSIEATGLTGRQQYRTVSGAMRVGGSGDVTAETVSGDVDIDAPATLTFDWHSVSGSLRARSPMFRLVRLDTMSGDALLAGPLHPDGGHRAHSVSGSLRIEAHGGLTIETKSLSGGIRSEVDHRLEGAPGRMVLVTGDGRARLRFDTVSGTATVLRLAPEPAAGASGPDAAYGSAAPVAPEPVAAAFAAPRAPSPPPAAPPEPWVPGSPLPPAWPARTDRWAGPTAEPPAAAAPEPVAAAHAVPSPDAAAYAVPSPDASTDAAGPEPAVSGPPDREPADEEPGARLAILRAVERGDIDVDEALRRLGDPCDA